MVTQVARAVRKVDRVGLNRVRVVLKVVLVALFILQADTQVARADLKVVRVARSRDLAVLASLAPEPRFLATRRACKSVLVVERPVEKTAAERRKADRAVKNKVAVRALPRLVRAFRLGRAVHRLDLVQDPAVPDRVAPRDP